MDIRHFNTMKCFECMTEAKGLKVGDKFITGSRVVGQVESKQEGQPVTYYEVINTDSTGNNFEYVMRYDTLTASPVDERKKL